MKKILIILAIALISTAAYAQGSNDYAKKFDQVEYREFGNPFDGIFVNFILAEVSNFDSEQYEDIPVLALMGAAMAAEEDKYLYVIIKNDERDDVSMIISNLPTSLADPEFYELLTVSMAFDKDRTIHKGITPYDASAFENDEENDFQFTINNSINLLKKHSAAFVRIENKVIGESEIFEFKLAGFSAAYKHYLSRNE